MLKVNEFETAHYEYGRSSKYRFSPEANIEYVYSSADDLLNELDYLSKLIQHHSEHQRPRLVELQEYYKGENSSILTGKRRREEHLADNRATHNFSKYVSQFIQGYLVGVPLKTTYPDENVDELIKDINRVNDADEHNSELVLNLSIFGRAYELLYRNKADENRFTTLDPLESFVIYDETVEKNPIAGVRYIKKQFEDKMTVCLYTDNKNYEYSLDNAWNLSLVEEKEHYFEGVPVIEYKNDRYRMGDFEDVLNLIDLYDASQSDTANYMQDLNDAMLKIVGNLEIDVEEAQKMKEKNILMLQTEVDANGVGGNADADYIYKKYDVQGTEAYKDRVFNNILLFTSIPNLLDDKKGTGNASGEALKMKLFALSQKRATKERLFKKSLRDRYRLISNMSKRASEGEFDVNEINVTFTENLPAMIDRELDWFTNAGGELSQETLIANLSFVENPQEEMERIEKENPRPKRLGYSFGGEADET